MKITLTNISLIACLTAMSFSCGRVTETDQTIVTPIPEEVISMGTNISYQTCGSGDITLLFVHGWCINQGYWSYQSDGFCSEYKIITMDLPGFGNSGKNRDEWTIEQFGNDVREVIEQLQLEKVVLVGHSMGGDIILEAARNNDKVIALVGVDNFKEVGMKIDTRMQQEIDGFLDVLKNNFTEVANAYAEGALFHPTTDDTVVDRVVKDITSSDSIVAVACLKELFTYTPNEKKQLSKLKQKLYLINSASTPTDTAALASSGIAFELLEITNTGHYPMIEKPGEFNQLLKQALIDIEEHAN